MRTVVTVYPNCFGIVTDDQVKRRGLPLEPYHRYKGIIDKIPVVRRVLSEGRKFVYYREKFSLDEFKTLVDETDRLLRDYRKLEG